MQGLKSATKIAPRRGASHYVPRKADVGTEVGTKQADIEEPTVMDWSADDRQVIGRKKSITEVIPETNPNDNKLAALTDGCCAELTKWYVNLIMFDPRNKWRIRWDVFLMVFIIVNAICVPIDVAVDLEPTLFLSLINNIADTFFLIDILVSFRTGYIVKKYGNAILHDRPIDVGCTYLKGWFIIDLLGVGVPYNLLNYPGSSEFVNQIATALGLLKLLRLARIPRLLKRILEVPLAWKLIVNVINLIVLYVFICHLLGCGLLVLGSKFLDGSDLVDATCGGDGNQSCTWTVKNGISSTQSQSDSQTYATAFYFSVTTAISVGYGDISATNDIETIVLTLVMLMTMMVTTVLFGSVVTIVDKLGDAKRRYDERRQAIEHFIGSYHIEDEAAEPMRAMIEFQWERTKFFDTEAVLAMLPTPLRLRVLMDMNKTFLFTVPFFQDCDEAVIKQIVQVLGHELVLPGTMIIHEGQPAEKMYFNRFGRFEMLAPHSYSIFHEVNVGDYFGEIGLLVTHGRYSATVRASHDTRCEVATLDRKDLEKLMRTFPVFCQSFKAVGLQRLRKTRTAVLKSRYAGQTEYRMVLEIIRGHKIMGNIQECIITGEVVCRTSRSKRGTNVDENGNAIENSDSGVPMRASVQFGPVHRTERKRGTSPAFGNVFIISICCHELQRLEDLEFELTMYQCHSWRPNSYIGSVIIYPSDVRLGQVTKQWYRLKDIKPKSECDIICNALDQQEGQKKKKKTMGQLLVRMVRHRDSGGRDAQLRANLGIRELALAARRKKTKSMKIELNKNKHVEEARKKRSTSEEKNRLLGDPKHTTKEERKNKEWALVKSNFLHKYNHRKKEMADGLRFGATSILLDSFDKNKRHGQKSQYEGTVKGTRGIIDGNAAVVVSAALGENNGLICNKKVSDSFDKISDNTDKFLKLGKKILQIIPEQVEEAHSDQVRKRMERW